MSLQVDAGLGSDVSGCGSASLGLRTETPTQEGREREGARVLHKERQTQISVGQTKRLPPSRVLDPQNMSSLIPVS